MGRRRTGRGLPATRRPREGPDHHRRPQRVSEGDRGAPRPRCRASLESAVIGVPDRRLRRGGRGRRRRARRRARCPSADIIGALRGEIASFKIPKRVVVVRRAAAQRDGQGAEERAARHLRRAAADRSPRKDHPWNTRVPATMRYVAVDEPGPPDRMHVAEGPVPVPKLARDPDRGRLCRASIAPTSCSAPATIRRRPMRRRCSASRSRGASRRSATR